MVSKIIVELTPREAELFKKFKKIEKAWSKMDQLRPGSLVIHFNKDNKFKKWEYHLYEGNKN